MKHQECLLLTKSLKGFFPPVLYSYSLGGKDFLLELIKQRELNSLRVVFMSEKGQGLQPYQMQVLIRGTFLKGLTLAKT